MSHFDLGRDLQQSDIVDPDTWPLDDFAVEQHVCCLICMEHVELAPSGVEPLTKRTGVFTGLVRCDMEAPAYVCLDHMDPSVFTPVLAAKLKESQSIHL
ncbi:hypothetical protein [Aeromonas hydrophila]|uniref:hypothetical protein n=1 Tax=Aeromonas hydrophila TaxID=644 RepID=UPI003EC67707